VVGSWAHPGCAGGHRFGRPTGAAYLLAVEDKLRNYAIGLAELGLDLKPVIAHFAEHLPEERVSAITDEVLQTGIRGPSHLLDGVSNVSAPLSISTNQ
jgi:hypothetical protein